MNGKYLLDTNIVIALFAQDKTVLERLKEVDEVFLPSIVLGELYFGAEKSFHGEINIQRIDDFGASNVIMVCDAETAKEYGRIKSMLKSKGSPIPENDIWIAAIAI